VKAEILDEDPFTTPAIGRARSAHGRHLAPPAFDTRWLWGVVIVVPFFLGAGVFWLRHQPIGPRAQSMVNAVEVQLVRDATVEAPRLIAPSQPTANKGVNDNLLDSPLRPIPEERTESEAALADSAPTTAPTRGSVTAIAKPRPVASGKAWEFQRKLYAHIARYRSPSALSSHHGVAQVMFSMRRDGSVIDVWVARSSGHLALDEAAAETIRRAQPLPHIPADMPARITVEIPISFDPA